MKNNYIFVFIGLIILRQLFNKSMLIGIGVGMLLSFIILKGNFVDSISRFTSFTENPSASPTKKLTNINNDPTIKKVFKDIENFKNANNYLVMNEALQHMEQFLKIRKNIENIDNKKQFYDLAKMERKKSLSEIISLMVSMPTRDSKRLKKIIKYLGKVTKKYLLQIGNAVNKEWNNNDIDETSGMVHLD